MEEKDTEQTVEETVTEEAAVEETVENVTEEVKAEAPAEEAVEAQTEAAAETPAEEKKIVSYDPMTGAPVYEGDEVKGFNEEGVIVAPDDNKKKTGLLIGLIVAAVVVIAAIVCLCVFVIFKNPKTKIAEASVNTFKELADGDNLLLTTLNMKDFATAKEYTHSIDGTIENLDLGESMSGDLELIKGTDAAEISGGIDLSEIQGIPYVSASLIWSDGKLSLGSKLIDHVIVYDYTEDSTGYISELASYIGLSLDDINEGLVTGYDAIFNAGSIEEAAESIDPELLKEITEDYKEFYKDIEVEKLSKDTFTINDKERKCKGYRVILTESDMKKLSKIVVKTLKAVMNSDLEDLIEVSGTSVEDTLEGLEDELNSYFEDMDDINIDFYIYKKQLAAIETKLDDSKYSVKFEGGDYRAQNMTFKADGAKIKVEGEKEGSVENLSLSVEGEEYFSYEYDSKSGELSFTASDGYDTYEFDGITILNDGKEFSIELDDTEVGDDCVISGKYKLTKEGTIDELSGTEFSINEATVEDYSQLIEDEQAALEELGLF